MTPDKPRVVARYPYVDGHGRLRFEVVRIEPGRRGRKKDFRQRRPDGNGGWIWNVPAELRLLYRLPEGLAAVDRREWIWLVEGEKDVETMRRHGFAATTNPGGAARWEPQYTAALSGGYVVVVPDRDDAGRKHVARVARELHGAAAEVRIVELPGPGKDVTDFFEAGGSFETLFELACDAPLYRPDVDPRATRPVRTARRGRSSHRREMQPLDLDRARALPIHDVAVKLGLKPDRRGYTRCPFHDDHAPSLHVNAKKGYAWCNPCGKRWDGIALVMGIRGLDFVGAVRWLLDEPESLRRTA